MRLNCVALVLSSYGYTGDMVLNMLCRLPVLYLHIDSKHFAAYLHVYYELKLV